jgi:hypothetical protein
VLTKQKQHKTTMLIINSFLIDFIMFTII